MNKGALNQNVGLTKQRQVVLQVIQDSQGHLTANEVFTEAKARLHSISFATVYNSLRYLKDTGHIAEIPFGSGASRFDGIMARHDHAICTECGKLVDLELEHPAELVEMAAAYSKFKPESLEFTLRGICPDCLNNGEQ
jgi:Fur family transcriptional regulator, peroxide stress response regulator